MYRFIPLTFIFTVLAMSFTDARTTRHHVPYFLSANHPTLHSFVRLTWRSCRTGPEFRVEAYDDSGAFRGTLEIPYSPGPNGCGEIIEFNSFDLENGNPEKGIIGIGQGVGDWQLFIESTHPVVKVSSYVSTEDGFMVPMHDIVPFHEDTNGRHITTFNFADTEHEGRLRIINPNDVSIYVGIYGQHDQRVGGSDYGPWIPLSPHEVITVTDEDLETYNSTWHQRTPEPYAGLEGELVEGSGILGEYDNHVGRWRLYLQGWIVDEIGFNTDTMPLIVMHLIEDAETGLLANLSSLPDTTTEIVREKREAPVISPSDFNIDFVFAPNVPASVQDSFHAAADKWESIIIGDLPDQDVSVYYGECGGSEGYMGNVDDLLIFVSMGYLGGRSGPVGRANVCVSALRGGDTPLPVVGWVRMNQDARNNWDTVTELFDAIVTHEIGHVLGFNSSILYGSGYMRFYPSRHFTGPLANEAFDEQGGTSYGGATVPMADSSHWHDHVLSGEIMAPSVASSSVISRITVQALADLGYEVDVSAAETYYKNVF